MEDLIFYYDIKIKEGSRKEIKEIIAIRDN